MRHPLDSLPPKKHKLYFWLLLVVTLVIMTLLNLVGEPLITGSAPYGIVSYELAGSPSRAEAVLTSWDPGVRAHAAFSLGFDYLFLLAYSTTIALACLWAAGVLKARAWPLAALGAPLAWGQWLAALLDALENLALTVVLFTAPASPWPEVARWSAILKFSLVFAGMVYAFLGLAVSLIQRLSPEAS